MMKKTIKADTVSPANKKPSKRDDAQQALEQAQQAIWDLEEAMVNNGQELQETIDKLDIFDHLAGDIDELGTLKTRRALLEERRDALRKKWDQARKKVRDCKDEVEWVEQDKVNTQTRIKILKEKLSDRGDMAAQRREAYRLLATADRVDEGRRIELAREKEHLAKLTGEDIPFEAD